MSDEKENTQAGKIDAPKDKVRKLLGIEPVETQHELTVNGTTIRGDRTEGRVRRDRGRDFLHVLPSQRRQGPL